MSVSSEPYVSDVPKGRASRVDSAFEALRERILTNALAPGTTMLEEECAKALGFSRTPVREALIRLAQEELVEIIPRRGFRVKPVTLRDIKEMNEVLACLEVQAAERLAAKHSRQHDIPLLEEAIRQMDDALASADMEAWAAADFRFHALLIELCGNAHLTRTARSYLVKAHRARLLTLPFRAPPVYSNTNHAAVVEAIRRGDAETARQIHLAHKRRWSAELADIVDRGDLTDALAPEAPLA